MIAINSENFLDATVTADSISKTIKLPLKAKGLVFEVNGTGEFSVRIETSPDGTNWYGINELDPFSVDTMQSLSDTINIFKYVRAKIDIGTSGSVTICRVHHTTFVK